MEPLPSVSLPATAPGADLGDVRLPLLEAGERIARLGSWEWRPGSDRLAWSDNLYRLFGLQVGEVVPSRALVRERTHPDDRASLARYAQAARTVPDQPPIEYRIVRADHSVRYVRSTMTTIDAGPPAEPRIVGVVQDITEQHLANREISAHIALSRVLAEWAGLARSGPTLLLDLAAAMECGCATLWVPEGEELVCRLFAGSATIENLADFEAERRALRPRAGEGLPGQIWASRAPVSITSVEREAGLRRSASAARAGLRGAAGFPALAGDEVLAVIEFFYREQCPPTLRLVQTMGAMGYQLGEFFSRRRGELYRQPLTARELEVLSRAANGESTAEIAENLSVGAATVKTHLERSYRKLHVADRAAAVAIALRWGLID